MYTVIACPSWIALEPMCMGFGTRNTTGSFNQGHTMNPVPVDTGWTAGPMQSLKNIFSTLTPQITTDTQTNVVEHTHKA